MVTAAFLSRFALFPPLTSWRLSPLSAVLMALAPQGCQGGMALVRHMPEPGFLVWFWGAEF